VFDTPADAWYVWIGVAAVSIAALGTALALPGTAPPPADRVAAAIDAVAASEHRATDTVSLEADRMRLGPERLALESGGRTAHAAFAYGPVVPADSKPLSRVLDGQRPAVAFGSPDEFERALAAASAGPRRWRPTPEVLTVRRVTWEGVNATLVG
jgi:hypothetical protein